MRAFSSSLIAAFLAGTVVLSCCVPATHASSDLSPVALNDPILLAHHGGEGASSTVILGTTAASLLTTGQGATVSENWTESLWGHLLLSLATQRDPELKKYAKRLRRLNGLTLLGVAGISGLGLAQGIYSYRQIEPHTYDVTEAHHAGGHDHIHLPAESKVPATLSIIGSGATLATLGVQAAGSWITEKQAHKRMLEIESQINTVLTDLDNGAENTAVMPTLTNLVGERAAKEFLQLWRVANIAVTD